MFHSHDPLVGLRYAIDDEKPGMLLRLQVPRCLLYEKPGGPYGLVYFRDHVPNDLVFLSGIAFTEPGASKEKIPPFTSFEEDGDEIRAHIEKAIATLPEVTKNHRAAARGSSDLLDVNFDFLTSAAHHCLKARLMTLRQSGSVAGARDENARDAHE